MNAQIESLPLIEEEGLRLQIEHAQAKVKDLEQNLAGIDGELQGLGSQRETYELLEQACKTLEKLDGLGAGALFWGEGNEGRTSEQVRDARTRAGDYLEEVGDIVRRRETVAGELTQGYEVLDILEHDLHEIQVAEQERLAEWVIERDVVVPESAVVMPWSGTEDDRRYRKSLLANVLFAIVIGAVLPMIDLPLPDLEIIPEVPDRLARLIEREEPLPPPAVIEELPPEEVAETEPEPEPVAEEPVVAEETAPVPEAVEEAEAVVAEAPAPGPEREVRSAGILAFSDSFSTMSSDRPAAALGAQARINDAGEAAVGRSERSMITSQAPGSSGGINLASLSRGGVGGAGGQIGGVGIARVESSIGGAGGTGAGTGDRPMAGGAAAGRTDEEIQIVFDRYKSALYRLYNRELRIDPTLRGQVVLKLTIEPNGSVSFIEVQSSDLGAPALEQEIAERVRLFDFGAKDVAPVTILYPIDFLPAA
jgi:outer membrane biosynthesis protein TonB